jgi:hypothetical protein
LISFPVVLARGASEMSAPVVRSKNASLKNKRAGASERELLF